MAVSKLLPSSGSNDFNIAITGTDTSVVFDKEYAAGAYTITISGGDVTFDLYAYNAAGALAGYTNSAAFTATIPFNKIVVIGQTAGNLLSFNYKKTYTTTATTNEVTAGPVVTSVTPTSLPNLNDTLTVTGKNFATNCTVTFTSANTAYSATPAKNIVRSSATSLIVTRPDNFPTDYSPYTLTVSNPGVTNPTGSNSHVLLNGVTAGTSPSWQTAALLQEIPTGSAVTRTLLATDTEGSTMTYSLVSGTLPSGLSLSSAGVISGTYTGSYFTSTVTVRATDAGGNFTDRAFTLFASQPVWSTSTSLPEYSAASSYSTTLTATDSSSLTYSVVSGTLPTGLSLNSSTGVISGSAYSGSTAGTVSFTVRATDSAGYFADKTFEIFLSIITVGTSFTISAPLTGKTGPTTSQLAATCTNASVGANISVSGGIGQLSIFPTGTYTITVAGARGADSGRRTGGLGAQFAITGVSITTGEAIRFLVGQVGLGGVSRSAGGGGGTFVWRNTGNVLLAAAGGGGGGAYDTIPAGFGRDATNSQAGTNPVGGGVTGTGGNGGTAPGSGSNGYGAAGAGWNSNGANNTNNSAFGGLSPLNGGTGGNSYYNSPSEEGGFGGGGGGGNYGGGGGGGYNGGGAGQDNANGGGGAGSYFIANQASLSSNNGGGFITFTRTA